MTEDLVSMAMAEAISNPVLASASLTGLIVFFNLARGMIFTGAHDDKADEHDKKARDAQMPTPYLKQISSSGVASDNISKRSSIESITQQQDPRDYCALSSAILNLLVGVVVGFLVNGSLFSTTTGTTATTPATTAATTTPMAAATTTTATPMPTTTMRAAFLVVLLQMMFQLLVVPIVMGRCIPPEHHRQPYNRVFSVDAPDVEKPGE